MFPCAQFLVQFISSRAAHLVVQATRLSAQQQPNDAQNSGLGHGNIVTSAFETTEAPSHVISGCFYSKEAERVDGLVDTFSRLTRRCHADTNGFLSSLLLALAPQGPVLPSVTQSRKGPNVEQRVWEE